ncbi:Uncharacterized protein TCM_016668 [Theobroma cacao]|uniref:Uncharacterized protein n=1 Tax=Theobroma cacao TaxID=3641 RepID=A0A061G640_THECC|nr:Uncharacterized protein TCM_016668 [Theobroma cacao]
MVHHASLIISSSQNCDDEIPAIECPRWNHTQPLPATYPTSGTRKRSRPFLASAKTRGPPMSSPTWTGFFPLKDPPSPLPSPSPNGSSLLKNNRKIFVLAPFSVT